MKLSNLNDWLALIANIGVLCGLVFLILEIDQSNRIAIGTTETTIRAMGTEINRSLFEYPEDSDMLENLVTGEGELTVVQTAKARELATQYLNIWGAVSDAWDSGVVSDDYLLNFAADISVTFDEFPGLVPHFAYLWDVFRMYEGSPIFTEYALQLRNRGFPAQIFEPRVL